MSKRTQEGTPSGQSKPKIQRLQSGSEPPTIEQTSPALPTTKEVEDDAKAKENFIRNPIAAGNIAAGVSLGFMDVLKQKLGQVRMAQVASIPGLQIIRNKLHDVSPFMDAILTLRAVSYTHLTLPTNREV